MPQVAQEKVPTRDVVGWLLHPTGTVADPSHSIDGAVSLGRTCDVIGEDEWLPMSATG
jgi:hypothetical protein